eukprot:5965469-Pyramimonas_sp.AAC.1
MAREPERVGAVERNPALCVLEPICDGIRARGVVFTLSSPEARRANTISHPPKRPTCKPKTTIQNLINSTDS